jgi:subtilisin-like proprotein convertase family protein
MRNTTNGGQQWLPGEEFVEETAGISVQALPSTGENNTLFGSQWYLSGIPFSRGLTSARDANVVDVWDEYDGSGVRIGVIDNFFDVDHPDLAGRFDLAASYDPKDVGASDIRPDDKYNVHGTIVASVIGADAVNGTGISGVAHGATLVGFVMRLYGTAASARPELTDLLSRQVNVDVTNNSWGFTTAFSDNFRLWTWAEYGAAFEHVATEGRDGLGTVLVFAAGNDRQYAANDPTRDGDNTNYHNTTNSRFALTVAATDETGRVTDFSTPGASVFVAAPGRNMLTARIADNDGNRANDFTYASGTSLAAPVVSGVVALMLEANPGLGYRDVQDILARSAVRIDPAAEGWTVNGAATWNGGGFLVNSDVGFGLVDAHAAVRLAETWTLLQTRANEAAILVDGTVSGSGALGEGAPLVFAFEAAAPDGGFDLQWIEVDVDITHSAVGDLLVVLISPDGTESVLVDRPGNGNNARANLQFTLSSNQFWGEDVSGTWQLVVTDAGSRGSGAITDWNVRFFGTPGEDDVYVFTDDFAALAGERALIADAGGTDTFNAAAVTSASQIDLQAGAVSTIAGRGIAIGGDTLIENAVGGDGNDTLAGNGAANSLYGGRGDDVLAGRGGNDRLEGGQGADIAEFLGALADYSFFMDGDALVVCDDRAGAADGIDHLLAIETLQFFDAAVTADELFARGLAAYVVVPPPADPDPVDPPPVEEPVDPPLEQQPETTPPSDELAEEQTPPNDPAPPADDPQPQPATCAAVLFRHTATGQTAYADFAAGQLTGWSAATGLMTSAWQAIGAGDADGDALADVFFQDAASGAIVVALQDDDGLKGWAAIAHAMPAQWVLRAVGDVTGDGDADALVQNAHTGAVLAALMHNGAFDGWTAALPEMSSDWVLRGAGDINGDGFADLVVQDLRDGDTLWANMAGGALSGWNVVTQHVTADWVVRHVADFNGDERADLLMQNAVTGETVYADLAGEGADLWAPVAGALGGDWIARSACDIDADGDADIVFQNDALDIAYYAELDAGAFKAWGQLAHAPEWMVV